MTTQKSNQHQVAPREDFERRQGEAHETKRGYDMAYRLVRFRRKSTIAVELEHALIENKHQAYILDGDNIRPRPEQAPASLEDRSKHPPYRRGGKAVH